MTNSLFPKISLPVLGIILALLWNPASAILITYAETADTDMNFQIDQILIRYDEAVNDASVELADFSVATYVVSGWTTGPVADDTDIFLWLVESRITDLEATPDIIYSRFGGANSQVEDLFGNPAPDQTIASYSPPVPLPAAAWLFCSGLLGLVGFARRKKLQGIRSIPFRLIREPFVYSH